MSKQRLWNYYNHYQGPEILVDPRALLANHIGWSRPNTNSIPTDWSLPEPDGFNHGIYYKKPVECEFLTNQVFMKYAQGWISLYQVYTEHKLRYKRWIILEIKPWAEFHSRSIVERPKHTLLTLDKRKNSCELSDNELLYAMNNYERLKSRTDLPELIDQRVGQPGVILKEYCENTN